VIPKAAIVAAAARLTVLRNRPPEFVVLTAFAALCQLQTLGRSDIYHQGQAATAGFLLLGFWVMRDRSRGDGARPRRPIERLGKSLAFPVVAALCAFAFVTGTLAVARVERGPLPADEADFVAGVRTLIVNSTRDEPVFVGLTSHRFTFVNQMLAYYLADRRAGVRVAIFNPGVTNTDAVQREMADGLEGSDTQLLLLDDRFASTSEESNSSRVPGSTILDESIASRYVEACAFGDTRILVSRTRTAAIDCVEPTNETLVDVLFGLRTQQP
jgi:hypothetical protein